MGLRNRPEGTVEGVHQRVGERSLVAPPDRGCRRVRDHLPPSELFTLATPKRNRLRRTHPLGCHETS